MESFEFSLPWRESVLKWVTSDFLLPQHPGDEGMHRAKHLSFLVLPVFVPCFP